MKEKNGSQKNGQKDEREDRAKPEELHPMELWRRKLAELAQIPGHALSDKSGEAGW